MTSLRSLPPPSSGSRSPARPLVCAAVLAILSVVAAGRVASARGDDGGLEDTQAGVTVDWRAGTLSATGGAAADLRMPSVDTARPGAVRRATAAASAKLRAALTALPLGGGHKLSADDVSRAVGRLRPVDVQYQSNGGAIVRAQVRFGDWLDSPPATAPAATLVVPAMRLAASPAVRMGGRELRVGAAVYRVGTAPADAGAVPAKLDAAGRLAVPSDGGLGDKLARGLAVIYVQKLLR